MSDFRFSLIVPTCDRHETLYFTLLTLINQKDFDNYEIIVCDNYSSPETKEAVDKLASPKIKYVRAPHRLSMADNWELAVSQATGEYITVVGDDDGLLCHALREIDRLIKELGVQVIRFTKAGYVWPEAVFATANQIAIPLERSNVIFDSTSIIRKVINYQIPYDWLPTVYNSFIHRDLIIMLKQTGRVFQSQIPDVYSGFALAYLSKNYASVGEPLGISGRGSKSTSYSLISQDRKIETQGVNNFSGLWATSEVKFHPLMPDYPQLKTASIYGPQIAEPFLQAKDRLFPNDTKLSLNRKWMIDMTIRTMRVEDEDDWKKKLNVVRNSLIDSPKLQSWFDSKYLKKKPQLLDSNPKINAPWQGFNGSFLYLDAAKFEVKDILGATELVEKLFSYSEKHIYWSIENPFSWKNRIKKSLNNILWNDRVLSSKKIRKIGMTLLFGDGF
jgi:glycosyltransferase involved in cell wall biosynthesis